MQNTPKTPETDGYAWQRYKA